jgi:hypothetical protein
MAGHPRDSKRKAGAMPALWAKQYPVWTSLIHSVLDDIETDVVRPIQTTVPI